MRLLKQEERIPVAFVDACQISFAADDALDGEVGAQGRSEPILCRGFDIRRFFKKTRHSSGEIKLQQTHTYKQTHSDTNLCLYVCMREREREREKERERCEYRTKQRELYKFWI